MYIYFIYSDLCRYNFCNLFDNIQAIKILWHVSLVATCKKPIFSKWFNLIFYFDFLHLISCFGFAHVNFLVKFYDQTWLIYLTFLHVNFISFHLEQRNKHKIMRFLNQIEKAHVNVPFLCYCLKGIEIISFYIIYIYMGYLKPQTLHKSKVQQIMLLFSSVVAIYVSNTRP